MVMFDGKIVGQKQASETNNAELGMLMAGMDEGAAA